MTSDGLTAKWLGEHDWTRWEQFARCHPHSSLFQTTVWREVLEKAFPHLVARALVVRGPEPDEIVAGTMVYEASSWILGHRLVSVPFASVVDPLVTSERHMVLLLDAMAEAKEALGCRTAEVRLSKTSLGPLPDGVREVRHRKHHYLTLTQSREQLYAKLSRSSIRGSIRRAEREGVQIRSGTTDADWNDFFGLHAGSRHRLGLPVMPRTFFAALRRHLPADHRSLLLARLGGETLGGVLGLVWNGLYLLEWTGDSAKGRAVGANQLIYWRAIQDAVSHGCHTFSLGQTSPANEGLLAHKRRWGAIEEDVRQFVVGHAGRATSGRGRRLALQAIRRMPALCHERFSEFCYHHHA